MMNSEQSQMYSLGRQAFEAGYPIEACNISRHDSRRSWWVAGHIDAELEALAMAHAENAGRDRAADREAWGM